MTEERVDEILLEIREKLLSHPSYEDFFVLMSDQKSFDMLFTGLGEDRRVNNSFAIEILVHGIQAFSRAFYQVSQDDVKVVSYTIIKILKSILDADISKEDQKRSNSKLH